MKNNRPAPVAANNKAAQDKSLGSGWIRIILTFSMIFAFGNTKAQPVPPAQISRDTTAKNVYSNTSDSTPHNLPTITITAFQGRGDGSDIAASLQFINQNALQLIDNSSLVSTFNQVPGVRLEQRSPGSLRLSVRGSLLRSPYGVRGVKFYLNNIPLTDAGGNTYFQSLSPEQINAAEIIKGPAGSLYGAGTGGAVLLHTPSGFTDSVTSKVTLGYNMGSFGRINPAASWEHATPDNHSYVSASHFYSKGDRAQDTARRSVINYAAQFRLSNAFQLGLTGFYSDLHYQTPGGITKRQLGTDTTAYPKSIAQQAAVLNRTLFVGASLKSTINHHLDNETSILWSHTDFKNPFTTNYEKRKENNYGGRTVFSLHDGQTSDRWKILAGMEWIAGQYRIDNFDNDKGVPAKIQYKDRLYLQRRSLFVQAAIDLDRRQKWHLQAGISTNQQIFKYRRLTDPIQSEQQTAKTSYQWSPKIGLTYKLLAKITLYATAARGFSTPTAAEIHPSDGRFDKQLQPERGWNLESGIKGRAIDNHLDLEASIYSFTLKQAIVRRADQNDIEYYMNAGSTRQNGAEIWAQYRLFAGIPSSSAINQVLVSASYSYQPYHFIDYQIDNITYDGNPLTGVPRHILVWTFAMQHKSGLYLNASLNATSRISLNDGATVYSDNYQLLQAKLGYRFHLNAAAIELYMGADNILNQAYSLGNDINAYGGRYFNPAPGRNYFTGVQVSF